MPRWNGNWQKRRKCDKQLRKNPKWLLRIPRFNSYIFQNNLSIFILQEINALLFQLNESRQAMQEEIGQLQAALSTQAQQLAAEQRADSTRNAELKRLRCENETLASRLATIEEDFSNYKVERILMNILTKHFRNVPNTHSSQKRMKQRISLPNKTSILGLLLIKIYPNPATLIIWSTHCDKEIPKSHN